MTSFYRIATKVKPSPVRKTVVIFDSTLPALTRPFGRGILRSLPTHAAPASFADMAWASQAFADAAPDLDRLAAESAWMDRYESGMKAF